MTIKDVDYRHTLGEPCPINPRDPITETFSDHDREGVYNACRDCHSDHRSVADRLADLEAGR